MNPSFTITEESVKALTTEQLETELTNLSENYRKTIENVRTDIKQHIPSCLESWTIAEYDSHAHLTFRHEDLKYSCMEIRFSFEKPYNYRENKYLDFEFMISSPATRGSFSLLDTESSDYLYYTTYGLVLSDKEFISYLKRAAELMWTVGENLRNQMYIITNEQNVRKIALEKMARIESRNKLRELVIPQLTKPENNGMFCLIKECSEDSAIVTYRNKPYTVITVDDVAIFEYNDAHKNLYNNADVRSQRPEIMCVDKLKDAETAQWLNKKK